MTPFFVQKSLQMSANNDQQRQATNNVRGPTSALTSFLRVRIDNDRGCDDQTIWADELFRNLAFELKIAAAKRLDDDARNN